MVDFGVDYGIQSLSAKCCDCVPKGGDVEAVGALVDTRGHNCDCLFEAWYGLIGDVEEEEEWRLDMFDLMSIDDDYLSEDFTIALDIKSPKSIIDKLSIYEENHLDLDTEGFHV